MAFQGDAPFQQRQMKALFRTDASLQIGAGHVFRCLTLAKLMRARGFRVEFLCRSDDGNMSEFIRSAGFVCHEVNTRTGQKKPANETNTTTEKDSLPAYEFSEINDALSCRPILRRLMPDWLIIDHYSIGTCWEREMAGSYDKLLVIDDLANREHLCDLLLDQTFGRKPEHYAGLVTGQCELLCGANYALLRPEFADQREYSLTRRARPLLKNLVITMGGVDGDNFTTQILESLKDSDLPRDCRITIILGKNAPWLDRVKTAARNLAWETRILVAVENMALVFAECDLAIGAAGSTSLERCCLGLPTIAMVVAENQYEAAGYMAHAKAAVIVDGGQNMAKELRDAINKLSASQRDLTNLSRTCRTVTDGFGCNRVFEKMMSLPRPPSSARPESVRRGR